MQKIRLATPEDAHQMLEIYRPYVLNTAISFETEPPSLQEFQERISENLERLPWLACEIAGQIVGYAYAGTYKSRCAYAWSVETTVYVHQDFHGQGIGKNLYRQILSLLKEQGVVNVIAGIALPNEASIGIHESLGFEKVAQFKDVGFKLGKWWDVGYWQLQLQKPVEPKALHPMHLNSESSPERENCMRN